MNKKNSTSICLGKRHLEWLREQPRGYSFSSLIRKLLDAHLDEQDKENTKNVEPNTI